MALSTLAPTATVKILSSEVDVQESAVGASERVVECRLKDSIFNGSVISRQDDPRLQWVRVQDDTKTKAGIKFSDCETSSANSN
jgi:hypothetical protein